MPSTDPVVNFNTPVELGYDATAVAESTRCLMCNYNIWFDPFRCVGTPARMSAPRASSTWSTSTRSSRGFLPELEEAYGWENGGAMILDEERCIRCASVSSGARSTPLRWSGSSCRRSRPTVGSKESYRDAQLAGTPGVAGGAR